MTAAPVAFVFGANGLIGNAICRQLGAEGYAIVPTARDAAALESLASELRASGVDCPRTFAFDATDDDAVEAAVATTAAEYGLSVAVNNVGRGHRPTPLAAMDLAEFDAVMAVTFRSVAVALRAELRALAGVEGPRAIVTVVSSAATSGAPGMSAYAAAKHALVGLTRTAAIDEARNGIRINAVAPGPIESGPSMALEQSMRDRIGGYMPLGRMGLADEVASAVRWLASPAASYVTGVVLPVDGGKAA